MELHTEKFGDKHQFTFLSNGPEKGAVIPCECQGLIGFGHPSYTCRGCPYMLHKSCAELPIRMVHPFHPNPEHPLLLSKAPYYESGTYFCDACGHERWGMAFRCSKCDFDLDLRCASLNPSTATKISPSPNSSGHPHHLLHCTTKDKKSPLLVCSYCGLSIEGSSVHVCTECKVLLHQRCAELPMKFQNHPFHPEHPLSLQVQRFRFQCSVCGGERENFAFQCSNCEFCLDTRCASLQVVKSTTKPSIFSKLLKGKRYQIQFGRGSSHPHPLFLCTSKDNDLSYLCCSYCELSIDSSFMFVCVKCKLLLHPTCTEFSMKINHPFHPHHPLSIQRTRFQCSVCRGNYYQRQHLGYQCSKCDFVLDIGCASFIVITDSTITKNSKDERSPIQLPSTGHPHPMFLCSTKENNLPFLYCSYCRQSLKDSPVYVCIECQFLLHPACAESPIEINHPFHPEHPLTYERIDYEYRCSVCRGNMLPRAFVCTVCRGFALHVDCATLMPAKILSQCSGGNNQQVQLQQQKSKHPHPLMLCDNEKNNQFNCNACQKPFKAGDEEESSIYACIECEALLHKSCADLPREIHHPFHPKHVLVLDHKPKLTESKCQACNRYQEGSFYVCKSQTVEPGFTTLCRYGAHITCMLPIPRTIKFDFHKHPLVLFDTEDCGVHNNHCKKCHEHCSPPYFKCGECIKYNLHLNCCPVLPLTIEYEDHIHSLTFTSSRVVDQDDNVEFFCDYCQETISVSDQSYSCTQCHDYDAHIKCVSSAIIIALLKEFPSGSHAHEDIALDMSSKVIEGNIDEVMK